MHGLVGWRRATVLVLPRSRAPLPCCRGGCRSWAVTRFRWRRRRWLCVFMYCVWKCLLESAARFHLPRLSCAPLTSRSALANRVLSAPLNTVHCLSRQLYLAMRAVHGTVHCCGYQPRWIFGGMFADLLFIVLEHSARGPQDSCSRYLLYLLDQCPDRSRSVLIILPLPGS